MPGSPGQEHFLIEGERMASAEENRMDPFNIGVYAIELGIIGAIVYAMVVLPALLKPMP
jgi:hypothetical protein